MRKRLTGVLLAAVTAYSALTTAASAYTYFYDDMETEQSGIFYARKYQDPVPADAVFTFSHPVYDEHTGGFSCQWDGVFAASAEVGWSLPEAYAGKSYKAFPGLSVTYDADFCTDSNSYFGIHGCTKKPRAEYYIIEGWGSWRPPGGEGGKGSVNAGGAKYDLYYTLRYNAPSIEGKATYPIYYCVRQSNSVTMGVQNRVSATVEVYDIFQQMDNAGLDMSGELESCGLYAEGYGGGTYNSSGSFTVHSASRSWNGGLRDDWSLTDDPPASVTTAPVQTEPAVTTTPAPEVTAAAEPKTGDANCDGIVDISDAVLVMRFAVADKEAVITDQGLQNADADKNGSTDAEDATKILLHIAKKIRLDEVG